MTPTAILIHFVALPWFFTSPEGHGTSQPNLEQSDPPIVQYCKTLSYVERCAYMRALGTCKDFDALATIYKAKFSGSHYAIIVTAMELDHAKVVRFCSQFPLGSENWKASFLVLDTHPKQHVIEYVKRVAAADNPEIRAYCYELCKKAGWGDLVASARNDLKTKNIPLFYLNSPFEDSLHSTATSYLSSVDGNSRQSIPYPAQER